tara:strand:+ start:4432 stop:5193 length:762 start_codon:yes stop_codon:yes gene_type:complete
MYKELIMEIKKKKTLKNIDDDFVIYHLDKYFRLNSKLRTMLDKGKVRKKVVKEIRAILHRTYGMFITKDYFKKHKIKDVDKLLKAHKSTKERLPIYPDLYQILFNITGKPKSILDLGCGFNPLSYKYMNLRKVKYYVYDISSEDLDFIKGHLSFLKTKSVNLLSEKTLPKTDVCFMFKLLNHIDLSKHHKESEKLLRKVKSKFVVISFPLVTISGKKMNYKQNNWLKFMCERNDWSLVKRFSLGNEEFFVVRK